MKSLSLLLSLSLWVGLVFLGGPRAVLAGSLQTTAQSVQSFFTMPLAGNELGYMRLGYCSEIIVRSADKAVLFDPGSLDKAVLAALIEQGVDLVVYTHAHWDHFAEDTAVKLFEGSKPYIAVEPELTGRLNRDIPAEKLITAEAGHAYSVGGITIDTLAGEHIGPIMLFRVTINGMQVFHGGDSAYVPLKTMAARLAFVPTGSPSPTCKPEYASRMVADVQPQVAVPMHGGDSQHAKFKMLVEAKAAGTQVVIAVPFVGRSASIQ